MKRNPKLVFLLRQAEQRFEDPQVFADTLHEALSLVPSREDAIRLLSNEFGVGPIFIDHWAKGISTPVINTRRNALAVLARTYGGAPWPKSS